MRERELKRGRELADDYRFWALPALGVVVLVEWAFSGVPAYATVVLLAGAALSTFLAYLGLTKPKPVDQSRDS